VFLELEPCHTLTSSIIQSKENGSTDIATWMGIEESPEAQGKTGHDNEGEYPDSRRNNIHGAGMATTPHDQTPSDTFTHLPQSVMATPGSGDQNQQRGSLPESRSG
jgi:hypothetical protein